MVVVDEVIPSMIQIGDLKAQSWLGIMQILRKMRIWEQILRNAKENKFFNRYEIVVLYLWLAEMLSKNSVMEAFSI